MIYKNRSMPLFEMGIWGFLRRQGSDGMLAMYVSQQEDYNSVLLKSFKEML